MERMANVFVYNWDLKRCSSAVVCQMGRRRRGREREQRKFLLFVFLRMQIGAPQNQIPLERESPRVEQKSLGNQKEAKETCTGSHTTTDEDATALKFITMEAPAYADQCVLFSNQPFFVYRSTEYLF